MRKLAGLLAVAAILLGYWFAAWSSVSTLLARDAESQLDDWQRGQTPWVWNFSLGQAVVWPGSSGFELTGSARGPLVGRITEGNADLSLALDERRIDLGVLDHAQLTAQAGHTTRATLIAGTNAGPVVLGSGEVSALGKPILIAIAAADTTTPVLRLHLDSAPGQQVTLRGLRLMPRSDVAPRTCTPTTDSIDCDARVPLVHAPEVLTPELMLAWRDRLLQERPAAIVRAHDSAFDARHLADLIRGALKGATGWILIVLPLITLIGSYALGIPPGRSRATLELTGVFGPWLALQWAGVESDFWLAPNAFSAYWCALFAAILMRDTSPDWSFVGKRAAWRASAQFVALASLVVASAGLANGFDGDGLVLREIEPDMFWRYPLWALVQQWILLRAIAPRMRVLFGSETAAALAVGALFGLLHLPNFGLMLATFAAGSCWAWLGYRHRALLPLALSHILLGLTLFALAPPWLLRSAEIGARFLMAP